MRVSKLLAVVLCSMLASGCARLTTVMRKYDARTTSVSIDAKQRVVLSGAPRVVDSKRTVPVICAEPSPDALSTLAAGGGLSLSRASYDAAANVALSEAAGSIGLRTQSIQLLRDSMYRLCEGYLAGAIDDDAFQIAHRRFQNSMVSILAIEQLTGAVRAPAVVLGGQATSGSAELAAKLTQQTQEALTELRTAESDAKKKSSDYEAKSAELKKLEGELSTLNGKKDPSEADKTRKEELPKYIEAAKGAASAAKTAADDAEKNRADKEALYQKFDKSRQAALSGGGSAASTFDLGSSQPTTVSDAGIASVASAVKQIVADTFSLQWSYELCTTVLLRSDSNLGQGVGHKGGGASSDNELPPKSQSSPVTAKCLAYMDASKTSVEKSVEIDLNRSKAVLAVANAFAKLAESDPDKAAEQISAVFKLIEDSKPQQEEGIRPFFQQGSIFQPQ